MALDNNLDNSNVSKHLGKSSEYACLYDPTLLVREPRSSNRTHLGLDDNNLPFTGFDVWNGYEVTALTDNGLPVFCVVKFSYPSCSKYIVESKSVKLYFNSFSMTKLGDTPKEVLSNIAHAAETDLCELLETDVDVFTYSNLECLNESGTYSPIDEWEHRAYQTLEEVYPIEHEVFDVYTETPELLVVLDSEVDEVFYHSALLRSRCRVTAQPDSGDVYIRIKGKKTVDPISLLKYIVSFRDECHFHEEICEAIYKRLLDLLDPEDLVVKCLYARRGGWDINPIRATRSRMLDNNLIDPAFYHIKTPRQ